MLTKNEQRNGFRDLEALPIVCGIFIMITARENISNIWGRTMVKVMETDTNVYCSYVIES